MEPLKEIGSKIKFYRIQKHMTIKDLAESICKSQATLYKYEKEIGRASCRERV